MKVKKWLTVNNKGACRVTKAKPGLDWNEVAIFLEIELPDALFNKPRLEAKITVPDEAAVSDVIESVVAENVQEAIEQATGLTFSVAVVQS
jgi:hypothetical protein